jgi:Uma2 family endonuclease
MQAARSPALESDVSTLVGPGGWWILPEPGVELPRSPEVSPDLAGWRIERLPKLPSRDKPITLAPDWVCEILSPSTASYDNIVKRRLYLEARVRHLLGSGVSQGDARLRGGGDAGATLGS